MITCGGRMIAQIVAFTIFLQVAIRTHASLWVFHFPLGQALWRLQLPRALCRWICLSLFWSGAVVHVQFLLLCCNFCGWFRICS